jgi:hypothetical protein
LAIIKIKQGKTAGGISNNTAGEETKNSDDERKRRTVDEITSNGSKKQRQQSPEDGQPFMTTSQPNLDYEDCIHYNIEYRPGSHAMHKELKKFWRKCQNNSPSYPSPDFTYFCTLSRKDQEHYEILLRSEVTRYHWKHGVCGNCLRAKINMQVKVN